LDGLLRRGISSAPSFALAETTESGVRAVVRGEVVVAAGGEEISGAGVTTWVERELPRGTVRVTAPGGSWLIDPDEVPAGEPTRAVPRVDVVESTVEPHEESVPAHEFLFAPPAADPSEADPPAADPSDAADHDGFTILQGELPSRPESPAPRGDHDGRTVLAAEVAGLST